MNDKKDKQVFTDILKGKKIARDCFDTPMLEGEIVIHAAGGVAATLRVAKIIEVINKKNIYWRPGSTAKETYITLKIRRAEKNHCTGEWKLTPSASRIRTIENCVVITDPKPEIIELFKDVE